MEPGLDELTADARTRGPNLTLGQTILADQQRKQNAQRALGCQVVQHYETREQVVGYEVKYRYAGEIYVQRLDRHPGDWIRVRVEVNLER